MGGARGSGFVSTADDVLEMRGLRGVGGVCEMRICLTQGWGGVWVRGLGLGFTNRVGTGGVWDVGLCLSCDWGSGWVSWSRAGWCFVGILCVDGRSRYLCIVLGGYMRILGGPSVQYCCTLLLSAS